MSNKTLQDVRKTFKDFFKANESLTGIPLYHTNGADGTLDHKPSILSLMQYKPEFICVFHLNPSSWKSLFILKQSAKYPEEWKKISCPNDAILT